MRRSLDLTALRSFAAVADAGGVTRAAARLNLTQSAVSMQLKRLEEALDQPLIDRSGRTVGLTSQGEQLLGYARRLLAINDEAWGRMTNQAFDGEIAIGVPEDVMHPHVPHALHRFATEYPRVRVKLHSDGTRSLKDRFARSEIDLILATEPEVDPGGELLARQPLVWAGAANGQAWRSSPLRFASSSTCIFRRSAIEALDRDGRPWEMAVESPSCQAVEVSVIADFGIFVQLEGSVPTRCEAIRHDGALPALPNYCISMYVGDGPQVVLAERLGAMLRESYGGDRSIAAE